jgi:hypothetical protein
MWSLTEDYDFAMEFELNGDPHHVGGAWLKLQPLSAHEANSILLNCLGFFVSASRAAHHFNGHPSDPISTSRSAIESHAQDKYGDQFRLLIDIARDSLRGQTEQALCGFSPALTWMVRSESHMIRRLALDAVVASVGLDPDSVILMLLDEKLLFVYELKHEVFRTLAAAYPDASEAVKVRLLAEAQCGQGGSASTPSAYERYNMLVWLSDLNPLDRASSEALAHIQENNRFAPRKA